MFKTGIVRDESYIDHRPGGLRHETNTAKRLWLLSAAPGFGGTRRA